MMVEEREAPIKPREMTKPAQLTVQRAPNLPSTEPTNGPSVGKTKRLCKRASHAPFEEQQW